MGEVFQDEKRAALSTDAPSDSVDIHVKWRGSTYSFSLQLSTNLSELKLLIQGLTNVSPESQKLIGLSKKAGTKLNANATLESHQPVLKNGAVNITLIGTPDAEIAELKEKGHGVSSVFNDFSHEFSPATKEWQQLQEFSQKTSIHFINEPRPGKKLLVLDLDHTLLDFSSKEDISPLEMKRPHMDRFLSEMYPHYDIAIWSQTGWRWLELKVTELGMMENSNFKICFVLDKSNMFKVESGYVKPLHLIWSNYPRWGKHNTLIVDDLEKNFVLNPSSGVLITAFYRHPESVKSSKKSHSSSRSSSRSSSSLSSTSSSSSSALPSHVSSSFALPGSSSSSSSPSSCTSTSLSTSMSTSTSLSTSSSTSHASSSFSAVSSSKTSYSTSHSHTNTNADPLKDQELLYLIRYLVHLADLSDVSSVCHKNWRKKN